MSMRFCLIALALGSSLLAACVSTPPPDPCRTYNLGTSVASMYMTKEEAAVHWTSAANKSDKLIDKLHLPSIGWGTLNDPNLHTRTEAEVRALMDPYIAQAGACYAGSNLERVMSGINRSLDRYRPSPEDFHRWEKRQAEEREDQQRSAQRATDFKTYTPVSGTREKAGQWRFSVLEARTGRDNMSRIKVRLENISEGRIIRPTTLAVWGYDAESPMHGGSYCVGFSLKDDYGNEYPLKDCDKKLGRTDPGLQPGGTLEVNLTFSGVPPAKARELELQVHPDTFGTLKPITVSIPRQIVTLSFTK